MDSDVDSDDDMQRDLDEQDLEEEQLENNEENKKNNFNLTALLFGNIDSKGNLLEDEFNDFSEHLDSLPKLGLGGMLNDVISTEEDEEEREDEDNKYRKGMSDFDALKAGLTDDDEYKDDKDKNAVDYSDIQELSEDCPTTPPSSDKNDLEDLEDAIPACTLDAFGTKDDKELMPPPAPKPFDNKSNATTEKSTDEKTEKQRKLDTPLADMLPSKYANVNVQELFPDFRPYKVLRFSRLFGPGKPTSMPQIWRHVKKRKHRRKRSHRDQKSTTNAGSDSTSDSEETTSRGFNLHFAPPPTPDQCDPDQEYALLNVCNEDDEKDDGFDSGDNGENKPKLADWRYGPAQIWYDMLDVPDSGDGFNYGFKVPAAAARAAEKQKQLAIMLENGLTESEQEKNVEKDVFLMLTQLRWEDDVVWDGNEIKQKVMQKLNSKTNPAGWLPSSGSRTAGAFSQPGKTLPIAAASSSKAAGANNKKQLQIRSVKIRNMQKNN